jgi:hypothetical protein
MMMRRVMIEENCVRGQRQCCVQEGVMGDMTYVEPSPQHPSSVLVDLQHLDVVNCESESDRRQDECCSDPGLSRQCATEGLTCDHYRSDVGDQR